MRDRDEEIDRLRRLLEEASRTKAPVVNINDSEEWRLRFNELQTRWRRDSDNYENELNRKDSIIMELRDKINSLLQQPTPMVRTANTTFQHVYDDRDDLIKQLRDTIADRETEIMTLTSELRKRQTVDYVMPETKVIRIQEPNMKEIRYEKDPYLIEQNARLSRELELALV